MSLLYAMPYMEAVNHIRKIGKEKDNVEEKEVQIYGGGAGNP